MIHSLVSFWASSELTMVVRDHRSGVKSANSTAKRELCSYLRSTNRTQQNRCSWNNRSLECYGKLTNLTAIKHNQLERTRQITFCGWQNEKFNSTILGRFPKLKSLHIEHGLLLQFVNDFPPLKHLKV